MDDEIQETVESILGKGVKVVDCEKKSCVREEEVLLVNGCPITLEGEDGAAIREALLHGTVPHCDLLNQILIRAGILRAPVRLETSLSVKSSVVTREEVTVARDGQVVDERSRETKEDKFYTSTTSEVWEPVSVLSNVLGAKETAHHSSTSTSTPFPCSSSSESASSSRPMSDACTSTNESPCPTNQHYIPFTPSSIPNSQNYRDPRQQCYTPAILRGGAAFTPSPTCSEEQQVSGSCSASNVQGSVHLRNGIQNVHLSDEYPGGVRAVHETASAPTIFGTGTSDHTPNSGCGKRISYTAVIPVQGESSTSAPSPPASCELQQQRSQ